MLKTDRQKFLDLSNKTITEKICFAASDLRAAITNPDFARANGGCDYLQNDLFHFVEIWESVT